MVKAIVVYESKYGNTKLAAKEFKRPGEDESLVESHPITSYPEM